MQEISEADSARKAAPLALCWAYVFRDGSWSDARPAWDDFGNDQGMIWVAVRGLIERPLVSLPAIACRMTDGSLVIVRAKRPPPVEPGLIGNAADVAIVDEISASGAGDLF